tara:strand:+ start:244 stop:618 length:375 start_codon:yes stop_codon:yes gene_type:complete
MKAIVLSFLLMTSFGLMAQIKRKDLGRYEGTVPAYKINIGQELLTVQASPISVDLNKENILLKIGSREYTSTYQVKKLERRRYEILVRVPYSDLKESFSLNGKRKEMIRKGIFPQPDCKLKKGL